jgi:TATA-box binding protein (TBP) (component of TFIID and TFIIIB)
MNLVYSPGKVPAEIVNVVAKYNLGLKINLKKLHYMFRKYPGKFNPTSFAAYIMNPTSPDCGTTTVLFFDTGNVVIL